MNRIIVFESIHQAIRAEKMLKNTRIKYEMAPTPREISASCGQSITFDAENLSVLQRLLEEESISFQGIFSVDAQCRVYEIIHKGRIR